jgi:hypothetical protein
MQRRLAQTTSFVQQSRLALRLARMEDRHINRATRKRQKSPLLLLKVENCGAE